MEKLKDFIYDKNDILIAFIVMAVAALIIFWRLDAIMQYPEKILETANETAASETVDKDSDKTDSTDKSEESDKSNSSDQTNESDKSDSNKDSEKDNDKDTTDDTQSSTSASLWSGGQLTKDITVVVEGASATEAINCLVSAGLFKDYAEYQSVCNDAGFNHEKVSSGTFTFEKGWTKSKVADTVNWG